MERRYNGRQKGVKGRRKKNKSVDPKALKGKKLKCAIETLNGDGEGSKGHGEAVKIDGEALKDDGELNSNGEANRAKKRH